MSLTQKIPFMKNAVVKGTIILTLAGIASRCIGFFYRIFLTRAIGSEGMGLFQLVTPVLGIVFAICSSGIQTGISKFCAAKKNDFQWLLAGLILSLPLSVAASAAVYCNASLIACRLLLNPDCTGLLKILSLSFPFSAFHNCVNGYYFGHQKTGVPAFSQLIEQIVRVAVIFAYAQYCEARQIPVTAICAVYGNLAGETVSFLFCGAALILTEKLKYTVLNTLSNAAALFCFALPLTSNRLLMHLLQSAETILIPAQLMLYGYSRPEATSLYGILNGMAIPLIMFPSAITNALSVMLLPKVSQAQSLHNSQSITHTFTRCLRLCMEMGIMSTFLFILYGSNLGAAIFGEPLVQSFVLILAWLCPFLYLSTTLGSILNGLGKTTTTCIHNIIAILIRITFLIVLVPAKGITAYLIGLLMAQIFICFAHYIKISRMLHISMNAYSFLVQPFFYSLLASGISLAIYIFLRSLHLFSDFILLCLCAVLALLIFFLIHFIKPNRSRQNGGC